MSYTVPPTDPNFIPPDPIPQAPKPPKKLKPARKQVKPGDVIKEEAVQTGKEYNIWYNKWAGGDREDSYSNKVKSQTRCSIKKDSGLTRANTTGMQYICLFFARGCCPYGWECEYRHTLPDSDANLPDSSKDCFARDKFADYRDDMGGVGSFNRQNRTLYVGRIKETGNGQETEEIVIRHFREWGTIERIRVLQYRSVAFVTYVSEFHAQFAKESMACQSLDNDEILNVRWATEDPNPVMKVVEKRRLEDMGQDAIRAKMDPRIVDAMRSVRALEEGQPLEDAYPDEEGKNDGQDEDEGDEDSQRDPKRRRIENGDASASPPPQQQQPQAPPNPLGLLSADTLEGLKYFAHLRQRNEGATIAKQQQRAPPPKTTGLGLAEYGSDDDD
ncbi:hypothetical protein D9619_003991 [Psilocybe cf. subviscida]|uniref:Pre-mRNA-splicing factor CWC2 n=1 Tax=Psilocybe cf. subviscida TaxID=2480587 RepID=A0A8H5F7Y6_9AGAR|nr:hypothetical protein D9619_003991 [Psilocybe cf. subviscida]